MAPPLKVATVGCGYFSQFHHDAWAREPRAELVAVCDTDRTKAEAFAARYGAGAVYTDAEEMLARETPDLFDIIVPPAAHLSLIKTAAQAKVATICQKAFCRSLAEAQEAVAVAKDAGILLVVHENFRFSPWFVALREHLAAGAFGAVYGASFRLRPGDGRGPQAYLDRQPYFQTMERFLIHETAIHFIDTFRFLFGAPEWVWSDLRRLNPAIAGEDAGLFVMAHEGGTRSLFDGNRLADHAAQNRRLTMGELWIDAEAGTVRMDGYGALTFRKFGENGETALPYALSAKGFAGDAVAALQAHVVAHLCDGTPLQNSAAEYLVNLVVEDAIYRASEEGRRITL